MGYSAYAVYSAHAVTLVGIKVNEPDLHEEKEVRIKKGPLGAKFDSETGDPLFRTTEVPLPFYKHDHVKVGRRKFPVQRVSPDSDVVFICVWCLEVSSGWAGRDMELFSGKELEKAKDALRKVLGDLWDEDEFRLWTVKRESY